MQYSHENDANHLREWFLYEVDKELSFTGVESKLGLAQSTLYKFVKGGRGLGANEDKVFNWAKLRGYKPDYQYKNII